MKTVLIALGIFLALPILNPSFAQEVRQRDVINIESGEKINEDFFASGNNIIISGEINGDVYLVAENIFVDGKINGDLITLSKNLTIEGIISGNIRSAARDIRIYGEVQRNVTALGLNVELSKPSSLDGSFTGLGEKISISSPTGKGVTAGAKFLSLNSEINGNATLFIGESLTLGNENQINGNLIYTSGIGKNIEVSPKSSISGEVTQKVYVSNNEMHYRPNSFLQGVLFFLKFIFLFTLLIIGVITIKLLPTFSDNCAEEIEKAPLKNFFAGLAFIIGLPLIIVLLILSLVGIPISLMLLPIYLIFGFFAQIFFILFMGKMLCGFIKKNLPDEIVFLLGFILFAALNFIPLFSGIISFLAICTGAGAIIFMKIKIFRKMRTAKVF